MRGNERAMTVRRRAIIVDDHPLCVAAVTAALGSLEEPLDVRTAGALRDLADIPPGDDIAIVTLDLRLPDAAGLNGIATVKARYPGVPVCVLSGQVDVGTMRQAISHGIAGFLPKTLPFDILCRSLADVLVGKTAFPPLRDLDHGAVRERPAPLSPAETRIMQMLSLGLQNKHIAFELGLAESTVKSHLARIFAKLKVTNRSQAILAYERAVDDAMGSHAPAAID